MYKRISIDDAKQFLDEGNCHVIDIRDELSFQAGHIPGAEIVNNDTVSSFMDKTDKNSPLLVCCYHGNSSQQAGQFFEQQGFREVYSIDGGFEAWKLQYESETSK